MDWIPKIFRRRAVYDDLHEEIQLHNEERAEQLMRQGMSPVEAVREARRAFGNRTLVEQRSREVWQYLHSSQSGAICVLLSVRCDVLPDSPLPRC